MKTPLRAARHAAQLTQVDLAHRAGVAQQAISNIEAGRVRVGNVSWKVVARLSNALGTDPRELFSLDDRPAA
jgi:transcriptional regulator with XRE-family HTH domain